jgi:hypothetical protein
MINGNKPKKNIKWEIGLKTKSIIDANMKQLILLFHVVFTSKLAKLILKTELLKELNLI